MTHRAVENPATAAPIDACWNRIGTRGDGSCPELAEYSRCPNCPVFEQAAATLLDRSLSDADLVEAAQVARSDKTARAMRLDYLGGTPGILDTANIDPSALHSALVFRIADEWLALSTVALQQIDDIRPIHSLPHRRNPVVIGLVNVHGVLTVAVSLGELLHLDRAVTDRPMSRNGYARMLVAAHRGEPVAFPVDEVEGVFRFSLAALMPAPATLALAAAAHTCGVLAWRDTTIGLLDTDCVFQSLVRSLR